MFFKVSIKSPKLKNKSFVYSQRFLHFEILSAKTSRFKKKIFFTLNRNENLQIFSKNPLKHLKNHPLKY